MIRGRACPTRGPAAALFERASALDAGPELTPREIEKFPPWAPIEAYVFVRIEPLSIRGRQWEPHRAIERD